MRCVSTKWLTAGPGQKKGIGIQVAGVQTGKWIYSGTQTREKGWRREHRDIRTTVPSGVHYKKIVQEANISLKAERHYLEMLIKVNISSIESAPANEKSVYEIVAGSNRASKLCRVVQGVPKAMVRTACQFNSHATSLVRSREYTRASQSSGCQIEVNWFSVTTMSHAHDGVMIRCAYQL